MKTKDHFSFKLIAPRVFVLIAALLISAIVITEVAVMIRMNSNLDASNVGEDALTELQNALLQCSSTTESVGTMVRLEKGKVNDFDQYAGSLISPIDPITSIALAKDGRIDHVYPTHSKDDYRNFNFAQLNQTRQNLNMGLYGDKHEIAEPILLDGGVWGYSLVSVSTVTVP